MVALRRGLIVLPTLLACLLLACPVLADNPAEGESGEDDESEEEEEDEEPAEEDSASPPGAEILEAPVVPVIPEILEVPVVPVIPEVPALPALPTLATPLLKGPSGELLFSGFAAFDWYQYFVAPGALAPEGTVAVPTVAMVRVAPRLRARYRMLRATAEVEFRHDFVDPGRGGRVILREAVIGLNSHGFRLEGGALSHRWGKMDVASPTDNIVALDYEEFLEPEVLPVPGIRAGFARGVVAVELVFVPAFVPSRFRHSAPSRWDNTWSLPRTEVVPAPFGGELVFTNHYVSFAEAVVPGAEENLAAGFEGGGRVDLFLPSIDLGFSFLATHDRLPTYTSYSVANTAPTTPDGPAEYLETLDVLLDITPYHERLLVPGFDFAVNFWRLVVKGEAAYFHTTDPSHENCLVDDPYVRYALGVELVLPDLMGPVDLAIRVQYNGDVEIPLEGDDTPNQSPGCKVFTVADPEAGESILDRETGFQATSEIRHPYSHAWYFNINLGFTPELSLDLRGFVDTSGDALIKARLSYLLLDRMELSVGALAMLSTGEDTVFTPYGRNHRLEVGLMYRF